MHERVCVEGHEQVEDAANSQQPVSTCSWRQFVAAVWASRMAIGWCGRRRGCHCPRRKPRRKSVWSPCKMVACPEQGRMLPTGRARSGPRPQRDRWLQAPVRIKMPVIYTGLCAVFARIRQDRLWCRRRRQVPSSGSALTRFSDKFHLKRKNVLVIKSQVDLMLDCGKVRSRIVEYLQIGWLLQRLIEVTLGDYSGNIATPKGLLSNTRRENTKFEV